MEELAGIALLAEPSQPMLADEAVIPISSAHINNGAEAQQGSLVERRRRSVLVGT